MAAQIFEALLRPSRINSLRAERAKPTRINFMDKIAKGDLRETSRGAAGMVPRQRRGEPAER